MTTVTTVVGSGDETLAGDAIERTDHPLGKRPLRRGDTIGRYLLVDPLGRGAMGEVFRAYDPDLDRKVALKRLFPPRARSRTDPVQQRRRQLDEAKAMARIDHSNVVTVHDAGMQDDAVFIAMELVEGAPLDRWLQDPHPRDRILDVLTGAARGLAAAHAVGVIHRDFKPANVLVTADGRAKVSDFGLADLEVPTASEPEEAAGRPMGTPAYMSPEHVTGVGIDARSDQFSFAITLYEALYGTRPFAGTTWPELATQISTGELVPALAKRRTSIDRIIRRALSVDPSARFPSIEALIDALERARRPAWHRWALVATAGLVAAGLALGQGSDHEACEPGARRIEAFWGSSTAASLLVGGQDFTPAFIARSHTNLEHALDDYATRWAETHDASCTAVGPQARGGTPAQQATAQCLENRLESLQGLVELTTSETIAAGQVSELVATLPALDDCTSGAWIPYPSDPAQAAVAAELHRTISRIRRARIADRRSEIEDDASALVERARALGEPYLLVRALAEQARLLAPAPEVYPLLTEAMTTALAAGHDRQAAFTINELLLTLTAEQEAASLDELGHLVAMARGLIERSGGNEELLGNLALNEANVARYSGELERSLELNLRAEEHFARLGSSEGVAKARLNQGFTKFEQGALDEAIAQLTTTVESLERDGSSLLLLHGRLILTAALVRAGRISEAHAVAAHTHRMASELYAPESRTARRATRTYALTSLNKGDVSRGRELLASLSASSSLPDDISDIESIALGFDQLEGRHERVVRLAPPLVERASVRYQRLWLELTMANSSLLLGDRDTTHRILTSHWAPRGYVDPEDPYDLQMPFVLLAVLSDAPPPPGTTWMEQCPEGSRRGPLDQQLATLVHAIANDDDPIPTVRRIRDELAATYAPRDIHVQLLDAWLTSHAPTH